MKDYLAERDRPAFQRHGLDRFDALWTLDLPAVDEPNVGRGGWSAVYQLELDGQRYFVKRQCNYRVRSLVHPFGEPTLARECRNIQRYQRLGIPVLQVAYYASRASAQGPNAILVTRALDGWRDLSAWLSDWDTLGEAQRQAILESCGALARTLHQARQKHGCLYPKHVFLRERAGGFDSCLIDLEKNRPLRPGQRDRVRDLEPLVRRAEGWSERDLRQLLGAYLGTPVGAAEVTDWLRALGSRRSSKVARP